MKKEVRKAMRKAKELERVPVPTREEIVATYKEGMEEADKLRKLLKPHWFIKDTDAPAKKKTKKSTTKPKKPKKKTTKKKAKSKKKTPKTSKKKTKRKRSSTRKKKSL